MTTITLKYKRPVGHGTITAGVPESYAEMSSRQFLAAVRATHGLISQGEFISQYFSINPKYISRLDGYQIYKMTELVDRIDGSHASHNEFYINRLPGRLYAPESNLAGMCFQQFMVIDTFYGWYLYSNQEEYLNRMIAALYLHRSESFLPSQERLPDIERRASEMAALDKGTRAAIMLNWALIKGWLCKSYPELFPMGDAGNLKDKPKPTRWLDVFDAFVGDNIPSIDNYKAMSCRDAFRLLNRKIKEAKKK